MPNFGIITLLTLIFGVSVSLLHEMNFMTKVVIDLLLFAGWLFLAIVRITRERRRARYSRDDT
jgi:hypothetical protein